MAPLRRRKVAVAVDDSPGSMRATRYAAKSLLSRGDDVVLISAVHTTPSANPGARPRRLRSRLRFSPLTPSDAPTARSLTPPPSSPSAPQAEGERVLEHHRVQLLNAKMPSDRIKSVVVRCKVNESSARAVERAVDAEARSSVFTLVPIRPRWRGGRRFLRTFLPGVSLRPSPLAFIDPRPRRLSNSSDDAFRSTRSILSVWNDPSRRTTCAWGLAGWEAYRPRS